MATVEARTAENHTELRRELARERLELVRAIESLRSSTNMRGVLDGRLPLMAAAAFGAGFVLAGGIGATARLVFRRRRDARTLLALGPFALIERS